MMVVRPAKIEDVDQLFALIQQSELGLSSLKISQDRLTERIKESVYAFAQDTARPKGEPYVFVMEDLSHGKIVGTSTIYSKVGGFQPFYSYEIKTEIKHSEDLGIHKEIRYLNLHTTHSGPTEIGSLFLNPDYWGHGHGWLLSMSRFMFMADFLERFEQETIAELRGVVHPDSGSPLWNALGSHFFQLEYPRAETLTVESKKFIAKLMPEHPIYIPLLPPEAQQVIGQVHQKTKPALAMLQREGFEIGNFVDIFDGGPTVHCQTDKIRCVANSQLLEISKIEKDVNGQRMLLSNCKLDFRCVTGQARIQETETEIDALTALRLDLKVGDRIRAVGVKP